tara:strand:+ start:1035 stop:2399 length:1365 start_codon:yes stop_codon:yes gene_type:complete
MSNTGVGADGAAVAFAPILKMIEKIEKLVGKAVMQHLTDNKFDMAALKKWQSDDVLLDDSKLTESEVSDKNYQKNAIATTSLLLQNTILRSLNKSIDFYESGKGVFSFFETISLIIERLISTHGLDYIYNPMGTDSNGKTIAAVDVDGHFNLKLDKRQTQWKPVREMIALDGDAVDVDTTKPKARVLDFVESTAKTARLPMLTVFQLQNIVALADKPSDWLQMLRREKIAFGKRSALTDDGKTHGNYENSFFMHPKVENDEFYLKQVLAKWQEEEVIREAEPAEDIFGSVGQWFGNGKTSNAGSAAVASQPVQTHKVWKHKFFMCKRHKECNTAAKLHEIINNDAHDLLHKEAISFQYLFHFSESDFATRAQSALESTLHSDILGQALESSGTLAWNRFMPDKFLFNSKKDAFSTTQSKLLIMPDKFLFNAKKDPFSTTQSKLLIQPGYCKRCN